MAADAMRQIGLTKKDGISAKPVSGEVMVVFPNLLKFAAHWIQEVETPIYDLRYCERSSPSFIATRTVAKKNF